jgi:hypothetical protein
MEEIDRLSNPARFKKPLLTWGNDRIGIGLLRALRERRSIVFTDEPPSAETVPSKSGHLVVCEQGEPLAEVIAANYAYALRAGLCLIPDIGQELSDELFGALGKISTNRVSGSPVYLHRGPFASSHFVVCHIFQLLASA